MVELGVRCRLVAPNEHLVCDGQSEVEKPLCDRGDVAVRLSNGGHEEILFAGDQFLNRDHPVDSQYLGDEIAAFWDRRGAKQQHPEWVTGRSVVDIGAVPLYDPRVLESLDAFPDGAVGGAGPFGDITRRGVPGVCL